MNFPHQNTKTLVDLVRIFYRIGEEVAPELRWIKRAVMPIASKSEPAMVNKTLGVVWP